MSLPEQGEPPARQRETSRVWRELTRPGTKPLDVGHAAFSSVLWSVIGAVAGALLALGQRELVPPPAIHLAAIPFAFAWMDGVHRRWWALLAGLITVWAAGSAMVAFLPTGMGGPLRTFVAVIVAGPIGALVHAGVSRGWRRADTVP